MQKRMRWVAIKILFKCVLSALCGVEESGGEEES